jgi:hypothetical protein
MAGRSRRPFDEGQEALVTIVPAPPSTRTLESFGGETPPEWRASNVLLPSAALIPTNLPPPFAGLETSTTGMYRALLVDEIAAAIVREVVLTQEASRWELTSLARTCRSFSEPALDVLWESPLLWNLAQRMNADIWTIRRAEHDQDVSNGYGERLVRHDAVWQI